jgi:uncharacterized protein GlcG (DUF336 family)
MPDEGARSGTRPTVSAEWAGRMIDAAVTRAKSMSISVTVVVVDESGVLKGMLRMDDAPLVSVQTAISKAYAAAAIGMPPYLPSRLCRKSMRPAKYTSWSSYMARWLPSGQYR